MLSQKDLWLINFPKYGLLIFIVLQALSIFFYPGGTYFDPNIETYSFTKNFLSDLGRLKNFSEEINFISCQLFNTSLFIAGLIFIKFYFHINIIFLNINYKIVSKIGSLMGILTGVSLILVGLTPADLYFDLHVLSAKFVFRCYFIASLCYSFLLYKNQNWENKYSFSYLFFSISLMIYIIISEFGPNPKDSELSLTIQVISQKLILIIQILTIYCQTLGIKKLNK